MQHTAQISSPQHAAGFAHPKRNVAALKIENGMRVADFGSGSGAYVLEIAGELEGSGRVYAIDVQRDLLRRTANEANRRGYRNVDVIWADLEMPRSSKLADRSIDLVLISNLLFQVPDKLPLLKEARRIVKPSGRVAVIDWNDSLPAGRQGSARLGPAKEDIVTRKDALGLSERAGFSLDREFSAGAHHYGLILKPIPQRT